MAAKKKRIKTTLIDLNTGKKTISYFDTDKPPKPPEWLTAHKALADKLNVIKPPELLTAHKALADRISVIKPPEWIVRQKEMINNKQNYNLWKGLNDTWAKLGSVGISFSPEFTAVVDRISKVNSITNALQELYKKFAWIYEFKEAGNKDKPVSTGKARQIKKGEKELKASNQILGMVCYFAGYFTPQQVKGFCKELGIIINKSIIREIARYRNKFRKYDYKSKSIRELGSLLAMVVCCYEIMTEQKIKGKRKVTNTRKRLESVLNENQTGFYQA